MTWSYSYSTIWLFWKQVGEQSSSKISKSRWKIWSNVIHIQVTSSLQIFIFKVTKRISCWYLQQEISFECGLKSTLNVLSNHIANLIQITSKHRFNQVLAHHIASHFLALEIRLESAPYCKPFSVYNAIVQILLKNLKINLVGLYCSYRLKTPSRRYQ